MPNFILFVSFLTQTNIYEIILKNPWTHLKKYLIQLMHYLGSGVSKNIPKDIDFKMSKKTGRIRAVYHNGLLFFTPRTDGGIAMSIYCAELFFKKQEIRRMITALKLTLIQSHLLSRESQFFANMSKDVVQR